MQLELQQIASVLGIAVVIAGVLVLALRTKLAANFASVGAVAAIEKRLEDVAGNAAVVAITARVAALEVRMTAAEKRQAEGPTGEDMREFYRRMSGVEVRVAEASTAINGMNDGVKRIEHVLSMLMDNELRGRPTK